MSPWGSYLNLHNNRVRQTVIIPTLQMGNLNIPGGRPLGTMGIVSSLEVGLAPVGQLQDGSPILGQDFEREMSGFSSSLSPGMWEFVLST